MKGTNDKIIMPETRNVCKIIIGALSQPSDAGKVRCEAEIIMAEMCHTHGSSMKFFSARKMIMGQRLQERGKTRLESYLYTRQKLSSAMSG